MTKFSLGVLNVNIIKAKNLQKIENGTKKILTIKNPIIKINYISGAEFSSPANKQGEFFEWNYKLNFEIIKDRTSFFMQCYNNNNSEDCVNLIGETRIPLIFAIENENFKQWYPIYLREKRNKFACKGEILIDLLFYSEEKIMKNNLNFSILIKDKLNNKLTNDNQEDNSSIIRSSKSLSSNSSYKSLSPNKSNKLHVQSPSILPRPPRNSSYASNTISKYSNHNLKNIPKYNNINEVVYNDNFFNDKYNDNNIYPKYKKVIDSQHKLSLNQLNEISRLYSTNVYTDFEGKKVNHFNSLRNFENNHIIGIIDRNNNDYNNNDKNYDVKNNSNDNNLSLRKLPVNNKLNEKILITLPKSSILSPSSIHSILKSSPQLKKIVNPTESDILLNKRLSISTTTTNTTVVTTSDSSTLCFTSISSNINNNWNESVSSSHQNTPINDKNINCITYSNDFDSIKRNSGNIKGDWSSSSYSPIPKDLSHITNTMYDTSLNNIINMNHSKSCELKFYTNKDDIQMETKSFHSMRNVPSNKFNKLNNANTFPMVKNHLNDINRSYLSETNNDDNFYEEENNHELPSQVQPQLNEKFEEINKLSHQKSSNSITFKQEKKVTLDELTSEEQEFIKKLNKKYNKKFILIDEKDTLPLNKENIFNNNNNNKLNIMTENRLDENSKKVKNDDNHINTSSYHSKKSSKKKIIFKSLLSFKMLKKKNKKDKSDQTLTPKSNKKMLNKIKKKFLYFKSSKAKNIELSENKKNVYVNNKKKNKNKNNDNKNNDLLKKKSNFESDKTLQKLHKIIENNDAILFNVNNERYKSSIEPSNFIKNNTTGNCFDINKDVNNKEDTLPEVQSNNEDTIKNCPTRSSTEFSFETLTSIKDFNNSYDSSIQNTNILNNHYQKEIDNESFSNNIKLQIYKNLIKNHQKTLNNYTDDSKNDNYIENNHIIEKKFEINNNFSVYKKKIDDLDDYLDSDNTLIPNPTINHRILELRDKFNSNKNYTNLKSRSSLDRSRLSDLHSLFDASYFPIIYTNEKFNNYSQDI